MSIQFTLKEDGDILFVQYTGSFDPEDDEKTDRELAKICSEKGIKKLLIDLTRLEGLPNLFESYQSGASLEERGFKRQTKIAFVDRPEFKSANEFYELVAKNRGFQIKHFYAVEDALEWL